MAGSAGSEYGLSVQGENGHRTPFDSKATARQYVWDRLQAEGAAAFPFPPHGRIPNFQGASAAADRLFGHPRLEQAGCIKVNPDAPQRAVREAALSQGTVVIVPTPRLRDGFRRLDPARIPKGCRRQAASQKGAEHWGEAIAVDALPALDFIVAGSAAVTLEGHRCGKGHGYSDLEYALLRELGHPPMPVATTVHPIQVIGDFPIDSHDLPVSLIATPETLHEVEEPPAAPSGVDWNALEESDLRAMPVLAELKRALDG